jgi:GDP-L-fucose synthase
MSKRVFIAGHNGMVGRAIQRELEKNSDVELVTCTRERLNLIDQCSVNNFFANERIDEIYLAAARVGGIYANNTYPAEFIYENLMIQSNVIHSAHSNDIQKLLFLGSSCIYPRLAKQPIKEEYLLTGRLEPTNEPYAIAKIAGIKMCEAYNRQYDRDYRSVMPTNLYGPFDNFDDKNSHVIPALISRIHAAKINQEKSVDIWGDGTACREFLYVDDLARAVCCIMRYSKKAFNNILGRDVSHINIGSKEEVTIGELALLISTVIGFKGKLNFDLSKPSGTPRKSLDDQRTIAWKPEVMLEDGCRETYTWYLNFL